LDFNDDLRLINELIWIIYGYTKHAKGSIEYIVKLKGIEVLFKVMENVLSLKSKSFISVIYKIFLNIVEEGKDYMNLLVDNGLIDIMSCSLRKISLGFMREQVFIIVNNLLEMDKTLIQDLIDTKLIFNSIRLIPKSSHKGFKVLFSKVLAKICQHSTKEQIEYLVSINIFKIITQHGSDFGEMEEHVLNCLEFIFKSNSKYVQQFKDLGGETYLEKLQDQDLIQEFFK
jgi:hypothetical protein